MKSFTRYLALIFGCLLIATGYNLFIIPNNLITFGVDGLGALLYYSNGLPAGVNILIINIIVILTCSLFVDKNHISDYILSSILIPVFILITNIFMHSIVFELPEMILVLIVAGVLIGYGYSILYKQGYKAGTTFLIEDVIGHITNVHSNIYSWFIDAILLVIELLQFNYMLALYSLFIIVIAKYITIKARFGINDSKMFYVITSKEKEVKDYIIRVLGYELTVLDVKGGFSKKQNQIFLCVIQSGDYYRLKEGIKSIDPGAFIAITDTYDVINRKAF